jgi:hypothetical protein
LSRAKPAIRILGVVVDGTANGAIQERLTPILLDPDPVLSVAPNPSKKLRGNLSMRKRIPYDADDGLQVLIALVWLLFVFWLVYGLYRFW